MNEYVLNTMTMLIFIGAIIKLFFGTETSSTGANGPASSSVCGYGVMAIAVFILLFLNVSLVLATSTTDFLRDMLMYSSPSICMLVVLLAHLILNATYYDRINKGDVPYEFNQFSTLSTIMTLFQLVLLTKYLRDHINPNTQASESMIGISFVLSLLNLIFVSIMNTIITYFVTDG